MWGWTVTQTVRCPGCPNVLGVRQPDGRIEICHRGRWWVGQPDAITCEKCGSTWLNATKEGRELLSALLTPT